jgi:thioredoxin 1
MKIFDQNNFPSEVLPSPTLVLVDFYATWCGPCQMLTPILEKVAKTCSDVVIGKVNVEECGELAQEYDINAIPAIYFFKNGEVVGKLFGLQAESKILAEIERLK